jgi:hypothetical protein
VKVLEYYPQLVDGKVRARVKTATLEGWITVQHAESLKPTVQPTIFAVSSVSKLGSLQERPEARQWERLLELIARLQRMHESSGNDAYEKEAQLVDEIVLAIARLEAILMAPDLQVGVRAAVSNRLTEIEKSEEVLRERLICREEEGKQRLRWQEQNEELREIGETLSTKIAEIEPKLNDPLVAEIVREMRKVTDTVEETRGRMQGMGWKPSE